jgi:hypothetical protein
VLFGTGALLLVIAIWLAVEASLAVRRYRREAVVESLEIRFD